MKTKALLACLFVAGIAASFAIAAPPPGKGNPHKAGPTASTGTTGTGTTVTTTTTSSDRKVTLCHKTGSKSNPWVKISVSKNAVKAHMNHGDVALSADGSCAKGSTTGGGGTTGTTGTTTGTTTAAP